MTVSTTFRYCDCWPEAHPAGEAGKPDLTTRSEVNENLKNGSHCNVR